MLVTSSRLTYQPLTALSCVLNVSFCICLCTCCGLVSPLISPHLTCFLFTCLSFPLFPFSPVLHRFFFHFFFYFLYSLFLPFYFRVIDRTVQLFIPLFFSLFLSLFLFFLLFSTASISAIFFRVETRNENTEIIKLMNLEKHFFHEARERKSKNSTNYLHGTPFKVDKTEGNAKKRSN